MKKVFVTGATGLLGSYFVKDLLQKGYAITASKRNTTSFKLVEDVKERIEWVNLDIIDVDSVIQFFESQSFDIIIHAAAEIDVSKVGERKIFKTNVNGTANLIDICLGLVEKPLFVFVSSISAIGDPVVGNLVRESDKWNNDILHSTYAESKYYSELEVWRGMEEGLDVLVLNPAVVLGIGHSNRGSGRLITYAKAGKRWLLDGSFNYIDARDVSKILIDLLAKEVKNTRFILSSGQVEYKEFFRTCSDIFHVVAPSKKVPLKLLKLLCRYGEIMKFFGVSFSFDESFYQMIISKKDYSSDKIREVLPDLNFFSLKESIIHISKNH